MAATFLSAREIRELDRLYMEAFEQVRQLKGSHPLARHICVPRLPTVLTESIAARSVKRVFGRGATAVRPGGGDDLGVDGAGGSPRQLVAVKGTGVSRWITVTATDRGADCLLWIDYADRLNAGEGPVELLLFGDPVKGWADPSRLTLAQAVKAHPAPPVRLRLDLKKLR